MLARYLHVEFGWKIYKKIGADPNFIKMYKNRMWFTLLLKINIFSFIGFSVQMLFFVLQQEDYEFYLTIIAIPFLFGLLIIANIAV